MQSTPRRRVGDWDWAGAAQCELQMRRGGEERERSLGDGMGWGGVEVSCVGLLLSSSRACDYLQYCTVRSRWPITSMDYRVGPTV